MDLKLVQPVLGYKDSFLDGLRQFQAEGLPWWADLDYKWVAANFEEYVKREIARAQPKIKGIGSRMLELALPVAKSIGLKEVLLTCDDTNVASIRIIEKAGGRLERKTELAKNKPLKRYYWISLLP